MKRYSILILLLVIAAVCKATEAPISALILEDCTPLMSFAFMCLGSFICSALVFLFGRKSAKKEPVERHLQKKDTPFLIIRIISEVLSGSLFIVGLTMCVASDASMVKSFAIVASALIAFFILKEKISRKLGISIILITLGCITVAAGNLSTLLSSPGILLVLIAAICNAITDNASKKLAQRNPGEVLVVSEFFVAVAAFVIAFISGEPVPSITAILASIGLGIVVYGIVRVLFQIAARDLGAAKCSTVTGLAPLIGAVMSLVIFQQQPTLAFFISLILLIPGFYLVIMDNEEKGKPGTDSPPPLPMEQYHDVRNYITAFGFMTIFALVVLTSLENILDLLNGSSGVMGFTAGIGITALMILTGCLLIILRHRDFAGIVMLIFGFMTMFILLAGNNGGFFQGVLGVILIILAAIMLLAKERKKYWYSLLFLIAGLNNLFLILSVHPVLQITINAILSIYLLLLIFASSGILPRLPLTRTLTEDESLSFEKTGSFIGYILIATSILPWMGTYILGSDIVSLQSLGYFSIACAVILAIIAVLMIFIGKNRFIGAIFLGITLFLLLAGSTADITYYIAGIVMFLTGLLCFFRKRSYLLLGLMCILYGIASFTSVVIYGESVLLISQFLMHSLTFLIAIYLAIAVFSQNKKLPVY